MEETNVDSSRSFSIDTLGPGYRFGNRSATNYTLNDLHKGGVDLNTSYILIRILITAHLTMIGSDKPSITLHLS
jgi:hypothetical protein